MYRCHDSFTSLDRVLRRTVLYISILSLFYRLFLCLSCCIEVLGGGVDTHLLLVYLNRQQLHRLVCFLSIWSTHIQHDFGD
jgi:hypothetical protein